MGSVIRLDKNAVFSPDRKYRYLLTRRWDMKGKTVLFIGLNPSTADENADDATIRRLTDYAKKWGYSGFKIINLYALVAKNRQMLGKVDDPVGPNNLEFMMRYRNKKMVVFMWGCSEYITEGATMWAKSVFINAYCFGQNKDGHPLHPLFLHSNLQPKKFEY
jgi:hypothetical protein